MSSSRVQYNQKVTTATRPTPSTVQAKVKMLQNSFPELSPETCEDVLASLEWKVKNAVKYLQGNSNDQQDRTYSQRNSKEFSVAEFSEWPTLADPTSTSVVKTCHQPAMNSQIFGADALSPTSKTTHVKPTLITHEPVTPEGEKWETALRSVSTNGRTKILTDEVRQELRRSHEFSRILWKSITRPGIEPPRIVILLRGVPGSGKSTLAELILSICDGGVSLSADDFFKNRFGQYNFEPEKIADAHQQTQTNCLLALRNLKSPIIIDNTNTQSWEMLPYVKMAVENSYSVEILEPSTVWKNDTKALATKNSHGVSRTKIKQMLDRYEHNITVASLVKSTRQTDVKRINSNCAESEFESCGRRPTNSRNASCSGYDENVSQMCNSVADLKFRNVPTDISLAGKSSLFKKLPNTTSTINSHWPSPESEIGQHPGLERNDKPEEINEFHGNSDLIQFSDCDDNLNHQEPNLQSSTKMQYNPSVRQNKEAWSRPHCDDNLDLDASNLDSHKVGFTSSNSLIQYLDTLHELFPKIPLECLEDIICKCNGDVNWATEILLDGGYEMGGMLQEDCPAPGIRQRSYSNPSKTIKPREMRRTLSGDNPVQSSSSDNCSSFNVNDNDWMTPAESSGIRGASAPPLVHLSDKFDLYVPIDGEDWFDLYLDPNLVKNLNTQFGDSLENTDELTPENLKIRIPPKIAFKLFQYFSLQLMQKASNLVDQKPNQNVNEQFDHIGMDMLQMDQLTASASPNLRKLMELEARLTARNERDIQIVRRNIPDLLATRLTIERLVERYPDLTRDNIEATYAICECSFAETIRILGCSTGRREEAWQYVSKKGRSVSALPTSQKKASLVTMPAKSIQEYREDAAHHHFVRSEFLNKMSSRNGTKGALPHYVEMYKHHTYKMRENNARAAELIAMHRERSHHNANILDLHHLFVNEAMEFLEDRLQERLEYMRSRGLKKMDIKVITGRGKNSENGEAKIAPAVIAYLNRKGYIFNDYNGYVEVHLK